MAHVHCLGVDFLLHMCTPMDNKAHVCACLSEHKISFLKSIVHMFLL